MSLEASRSGGVVLAVLVAALVVPGGEAVAKVGKKGKINAGKVAAAEHKAMVQQQEARPNRVATQPHRTAINHSGARYARRAGYAGNRNGRGQNGAMVAALHSVVGHLHRADHDYDGHRVQAIHQLEQAMHVMQGGTNANRVNGVGTGNVTGNRHATNGINGTGTNGTAGGQRMSQAESDAHLREAHRELQTLEGRMSSNNGVIAAQHPQAHGHIQQALRHLNTALETR